MDYAQYKKIKEDIENEYHRNLDALEIIWKRAQGLAGTPIGGEGHYEHPNGDIGVSEAIRKVIEGIGNQEFAADDIQQGLKDHGFVDGRKLARFSITNTLHRLSRRGELEVVKKGAGRLSSIYKRKISSETV